MKATKGVLCDSGFSTFSTGFSTGKIEKTLDKPWVIKGFLEIHKFFYTTVENFLVYRTLLKFHLSRENTGMSGRHICFCQRAIHTENVFSFPA